MSDQNDPFAESLARILSTQGASVQPDTWHAPLWGVLEEAGFTRALVGEDRGGPGLAWADAFALLAQSGEAVVSVPLAECMLAQWLLAIAGLDGAAGLTCLAAGSEPLSLDIASHGKATVSGELPHVAWGRQCAGLVTIGLNAGQPAVVYVDRISEHARIAKGNNLAGEPRDRLVFENAPVRHWCAAPISALDLLAIAALVRSAQMAGALRAIVRMTLDYANLREQFGRRLTAFQVIQHQLASLASQTAAALAAAQAGFDGVSVLLDAPDREHDAIADSIAVTAAKVRTGEAAGIGAAIGHQVFGAIGFTEEHSLHLHTKRLWSWRDEFGNEAFWSARIGHSIIAAGPNQVWARVTAPPSPRRTAAMGVQS